VKTIIYKFNDKKEYPKGISFGIKVVS